MLRLLPTHESYRTVDGSIAEPGELDEAERHLQYLIQGESFNTERSDLLLDNKSVKKSSRIVQFTPFIGPHGLIRSSGQLRRLAEIDFDTKHLIVLEARQTFVTLFLRRTHLRVIRASITYGQRYRDVTPTLNYVPHCVPSNQTASCVESSVQQPFNLSWQTSQRRDSHTSLLPLTTPGLITSAHSMSQFV